MLRSLRLKYRSLFMTSEDYHQKGIILSDDILLNLESGPEINSLPIPAIIPDYPVGDKIGEGVTSETFIFLEELTPFQLVVQYHPVTLPETQHLAYISSILTQLYTLCPHLVIYLGYYLAPAFESEEKDSFSENRSSEDFFIKETTYSSSSSEEHIIKLDYDCYAFLYERIPITLDCIYMSFRSNTILVRSALAQLFFTLELIRRCGFNHGDITLANLAWVEQPYWQGRFLLSYNYYAYIIGTSTYYLPSGPILRLIDFNLTSYDDGTLSLTPSVSYQDDFESALLLAQDLLPPEEYQELVISLEREDDNGTGWTSLYTKILPQSGDKVILLGRLPELSTD